MSSDFSPNDKKLLHKNYLKQRRIEGEQRQKREDDQAKVQQRSMTLERNVGLKSLVSVKKASRSLVRIDSTIRNNMETIDLYRNW